MRITIKKITSKLLLLEHLVQKAAWKLQISLDPELQGFPQWGTGELPHHDFVLSIKATKISKKQ